MENEGNLILLALGPASAIGLYWLVHRHYRNTDKSHAYEHETAVEVLALTGAESDRKVDEVRGDGVVGEQPELQPGEAFQYTSGCPLATPVGSMRGSYQCVAEDGTAFEVPIPEFVLSMPRVLH